MKKSKIRTGIVVVGMSLLVSACGVESEPPQTGATVEHLETETKQAESGMEENVSGENWEVTMDGIAKGTIDAKVAVHDPSIYEENGMYYIFGSHMATAKSSDTRTWEYVGNGYKPSNPVYEDLWASDSHVFDYSGSGVSLIPTDDKQNHVWAPDVIYNKAMGCYVLYYCTSSDWRTSNLCYATADSIEGPYSWQGALIYSGFTEDTIEATDVLSYVEKEEALSRYTKPTKEYNYTDYPNAIDPHVFYDKEDRMWMVYGSWSGGIFLIEIDEATGQVIHPETDESQGIDAYFGKKLLGGGHNSIEGPYIMYDPNTEYYYLFVSYGGLTRDGGYQIRVFRSEAVDGEYVDMNGEKPDKSGTHEKYGLKLSGNYMLPSLTQAYKATGHNSAMINSEGDYLLCYHTRFENKGENHEPRVKQFFINQEGWPCVLPYAYGGEKINVSGYDKEEILGRYYVVNPDIMISGEVAQPFYMELREDGTIAGDGLEGNWTYEEGSAYMTVTFNDTKRKPHTYSGVFCRQADEAGTEVMTFTAVGNNRSVWGVKY